MARDLGLGRAPGTDQITWRALRRDPLASDRFPQDVVELQGLLSDKSPLPGIHAIPGEGTHVPLYILGSSLFGAQLAAANQFLRAHAGAPGGAPALADTLSVAPGYELALSAALGIRLRSAIATDLGSTNGTVLAQPGLDPEELTPGIAVSLIPGAVLDLGDGVTIQVTNA